MKRPAARVDGGCPSAEIERSIEAAAQRHRPNTPDTMATTGPDRRLPNTRIKSNIEMSALARLDGDGRRQVRPVKHSSRPGHGHEISSWCLLRRILSIGIGSDGCDFSPGWCRNLKPSRRNRCRVWDPYSLDRCQRSPRDPAL
jgi:hypothetical protein